MTPDMLKRRLAAWPAASAQALGPALDAAAETLAAELRRQLGSTTVRSGADPVTIAQLDDGRVVVTLSTPDAVAREFGTRRTAARPVLRPAVAAMRDGIGRCLAEGLRHALAIRSTR